MRFRSCRNRTKAWWSINTLTLSPGAFGSGAKSCIALVLLFSAGASCVAETGVGSGMWSLFSLPDISTLIEETSCCLIDKASKPFQTIPRQ